MATISFGGLASGIDTNSIINQLMQLQRLPVQRLQQRISQQQSNLSLFQTLNTRLTEVATQSAKVQDPDDLDARTVTSSDEDIVTATAGSNAVLGSFKVEVVQTARQEAISSTVSWADAADTIDTGGDIVVNGTTITLLATDSIQSVVNKINDADAGVSASVVQVSEGDYRISLISEEAGETGMTLENGGATDMVGTVLGLTQVNQTGQSAIVRVNGLEITRNTNTISDAIEGITLELNGASEGTLVTVTVARDKTAISDAIDDFVNALNSARQFIVDQTKYNAETKTGGPLMGDTTARLIQNRLLEISQASVPAMQTARLSELNDEAGVAAGSIQITDRNGGTATIDLTNTYTVQDVLDAINDAEDIAITASVNSDGTAIVLTDTSEGTGSITVAESGSTTAADLGILGSSSEATLVGSDVGDGAKIALSTIGITTNSSGVLQIDEDALDDALDENFDAVVSLFTTAGIGLGEKAEDVVDLLTDPIDGTIKARQDAINARIDSMQDQIDRMERLLERREESLVRQFSVLETMMAQYQAIGDFLTANLAANQQR